MNGTSRRFAKWVTCMTGTSGQRWESGRGGRVAEVVEWQRWESGRCEEVFTKAQTSSSSSKTSIGSWATWSSRSTSVLHQTIEATTSSQDEGRVQRDVFRYITYAQYFSIWDLLVSKSEHTDKLYLSSASHYTYYTSSSGQDRDGKWIII